MSCMTFPDLIYLLVCCPAVTALLSYGTLVNEFANTVGFCFAAFPIKPGWNSLMAMFCKLLLILLKISCSISSIAVGIIYLWGCTLSLMTWLIMFVVSWSSPNCFYIFSKSRITSFSFTSVGSLLADDAIETCVLYIRSGLLLPYSSILFPGEFVFLFYPLSYFLRFIFLLRFCMRLPLWGPVGT